MKFSNPVNTSMGFSCPAECGAWLMPDETECECGWKLPKRKAPPPEASQLRSPAVRSMSVAELEKLEQSRAERREAEKRIVAANAERLANVPKDRRWAAKILLMEEHGYHSTPVALEMAKAAMNTPLQAQEEPGATA